jgi:hypothetical protein
MTRITESNLQAIVGRINRMTGSPAEPWGTLPNGSNASNVGNYHLDHAYGGVALYRMANNAGGCSDVLNCGHVSKRELQSLMFAYIQGLYHGADNMARTEVTA